MANNNNRKKQVMHHANAHPDGCQIPLPKPD